ncbi:MAG: 4-hydroxy-tetrahydrodipicolinate reductase, partial [Oxalobacteraceae bacterium]|nr:4-hydroxy-tetrahydrodipicolinate reductase [Oxalobacteraceae bacterium]
MKPLKIAVAGASGRMGRMLIEAIESDPDTQLSGALDIAGAPGLGADAGSAMGRTLGVTIESAFERGLANAEFLIDFTRPAGTLAHLSYCA